MVVVKKSVLLSSLALSALGLAAQAPASAAGWYSSLSGGVSKADLPSRAAFDDIVLGTVAGTSSLDDTGDAWAIHVGYRFNSYVAAEVGYVEFGKFRYEAVPNVAPVEASVRFRTNGPVLAAVGILPLGERFDLSVRGGVYFSDTRVRQRIVDLTDDSVIVSAEDRASDKDLFVGIGAAWNINDNYGLRVDLQRYFDVGDDDHTGERDVDLLTFGVVFR